MTPTTTIVHRARGPVAAYTTSYACAVPCFIFEDGPPRFYLHDIDNVVLTDDQPLEDIERIEVTWT